MAQGPGPLVTATDGRLLVRLKVVPGATVTELAGALGDRLKVRVAAPPEGGAANRAVLALLARRLGVSPRSLTLVSGQGSPLKVVAVSGPAPKDAARRLDLA